LPDNKQGDIWDILDAIVSGSQMAADKHLKKNEAPAYRRFWGYPPVTPFLPTFKAADGLLPIDVFDSERGYLNRPGGTGQAELFMAQRNKICLAIHD
jgi:hypothetical protein